MGEGVQPFGPLFLTSLLLYAIATTCLFIWGEVAEGTLGIMLLIGLLLSLVPALLTAWIVRHWKLSGPVGFIAPAAAIPWFYAGLSEALWEDAARYGDVIFRLLFTASLAFALAGALNWLIWNWQNLVDGDLP